MALSYIRRLRSGAQVLLKKYTYLPVMCQSPISTFSISDPNLVNVL